MIEDLILDHIKRLKPYQSARSLYLKQGGILLDANENPLGSVIDSEYSGISLNRYPDPKQNALRQAVSTLINVPIEKLFFGVGSDEIIDLLMRLFCAPQKDTILIVEPTYGMYLTVSEIQNVEHHICLLDANFQISTEKVISSVLPSDKMIFLCSPNNPTGNLLSEKEVEFIALSFPGIIVVDEAYIDFARDGASMINLCEKYRNVVILRTFSKAWGMAAARCGYTVADPEVILNLFKIKAPYSINVLTEKAILQAIKNNREKDIMINRIIAQKEILIEELKKISYIERIFPSDANYILIRLPMAKEIQKVLADKGVIIRDRSSQPMLENCLRISVGTSDENKKLIECLKIVSEEI